MFREKYRTYINWAVTVIVILIVGISFFFVVQRWNALIALFHRLGGILAPVMFGIPIAFILDSLVSALMKLFTKLPARRKPLSRRRISVCRAVSIALSEIVFVAVITLLIQSIVPQVTDSLRRIISNSERYIANFQAWVRPMLDDYPDIEVYVTEQLENISKVVRNFLTNDLGRLVGIITSSITGVGTYVYNFIIGLIVSIYLLANKTHILGLSKKLIYTLFGPVPGNRTIEVGRYTTRVFKGFLVGKLLDSMIVGVLCFLGTTLLGIPYSMLISIVVGVTNVIPYFGPIIGAVPSGLLVLMLDPIKCLYFVIFILLLQQLDGNVIGPKILGNTTGVSSLGVMLSILVGGGLFGLPGMILSVPTYGVIYSLVKAAAEHQLSKRGLPTDTETYAAAKGIDPASLGPVEEARPAPASTPAPVPAPDAGGGKAAKKKKKK